MDTTLERVKRIQSSNWCSIFYSKEDNDKVCYDCHLTGKYRVAARIKCNPNLASNRFNWYFLHNLELRGLLDLSGNESECRVDKRLPSVPLLQMTWETQAKKIKFQHGHFGEKNIGIGENAMDIAMLNPTVNRFM